MARCTNFVAEGKKKFHGYSVQGGNYPYFNLTFILNQPPVQNQYRLNNQAAAMEQNVYMRQAS